MYTCDLILHNVHDFLFHSISKGQKTVGHDNSTLIVARCITCNKMNATGQPLFQ